MLTRARIFWALILLCGFASAAGAQNTAPTSNTFTIAVADVHQSDNGDMVANFVRFFEPDTVIDYGITVVVVDSLDDSSPKEMIIDVTGRWKGQLHAERHTVRLDAEFIFPQTSGGVSGFPDSVFHLTWDKPGDADRYTYQSKPIAGMKFDGKTLAGIVLEIAHSELHKGNMYEVGFDSIMSVNDTILYAFVMPDDENFSAHMDYEISSSGGSWFNFAKEDSSFSGLDTILPQNVHFGSSNTSELIVYKAAIAEEDGVNFMGHRLGAGQTRGGQARAIEEYVFQGGVGGKVNLFRFVSLANTNSVTVRFRWYEIKGR